MRLDSGNLGELAATVRRILDEAGLGDSKIMATGDLNEYKIQELMAARAPIDVFGVGTELATSADAPSLGVVYKLVELEDAGGRRYPVKLSHDKQTLPGAKQIFRSADHDVLARASECIACGEGRRGLRGAAASRDDRRPAGGILADHRRDAPLCFRIAKPAARYLPEPVRRRAHLAGGHQSRARGVE